MEAVPFQTNSGHFKLYNSEQNLFASFLFLSPMTEPNTRQYKLFSLSCSTTFPTWTSLLAQPKFL